MASRSFNWKLAERILWTAIQAALGVLTVEGIELLFSTDIPDGVAVPVAAFLSWLKGQIARKVGDPHDPALLPAGV